MAINQRYPYTDIHELNLDWILAKMKELKIEFDEFKVVNQISFSGAWDITKNYPAWTIVSDNNIGYVSIQPVPAGVLLTNGDYWREVIDYSAQIAGLQSRVVALENTVGDSSSGLVHDVDEIQKYKINYVTPEMFGAVGDGVTDDSQAISDAIDAAIANTQTWGQFPWGSVPVIFSAASYLCDSPIDITDKFGINLISDNHGSMIICPNGFLVCDNAGLSSNGTRGLTIEGITFVCDNSETILKIHKPRFTRITDCCFRSTTDLRTAVGIETCGIVDLKVERCTFTYLEKGILFIDDTVAAQSTTTYITGCRFTTLNHGIYSAFVNLNSYIKDLIVDKSIFESGTNGIRIGCGINVSHVIVKNSHFEMESGAAVFVSGGTLEFDESNFVYVGVGSVGVVLYNSNINTDPLAPSVNKISVNDDNAINALAGITISSIVNSIIKAGTWELNTFEKYYIRTVLSLNITTLTPNISYAKVEFDNDTGFYRGYFVKSGGTWTLTNVDGNLSMLSDNTGGIQAPTSGRFKITYG